MSKVDGKFNFSPLSVNFLIEAAKVLFAIVMLLFQVHFTFFSSHLSVCLIPFFLFVILPWPNVKQWTLHSAVVIVLCSWLQSV